jgi:hypothetical protein
MNAFERLKQRIRRNSVYKRLREMRDLRRRARIHQPSGYLSPGTGPATFIVVCGGEFDQSIPNAATMCRMGWCRGFEQHGIPYRLVAAQDLHLELPSFHNPICWISGSDYAYLDALGIKALARVPHGVLVSTAFDQEEAFFASRGFPNVSWEIALRKRILSSSPPLLFTMSGKGSFGFYEWWIRTGARLVSLPLACDTSLYRAPARHASYDGVQVAFVGGYWRYKAIQFDRFLRPLADKLWVYGYSSWPYGRYGGQIGYDQEGSLYRQAAVSPIINEPHVCEMSVDINERVFKVLGAGGLGVCDPTSGYREWFSSEELLVPSSEDEYWDMINAALVRPESLKNFRAAGSRAVLAKHTYAHRAAEFVKELGMKGVLPSMPDDQAPNVVDSGGSPVMNVSRGGMCR